MEMKCGMRYGINYVLIYKNRRYNNLDLVFICI